MYLSFTSWQRMSTVVMQSLAYLQHSSPVPGAKLFISGDLKLQQKTPLPHRGVYDIYNVGTYWIYTAPHSSYYYLFIVFVVLDESAQQMFVICLFLVILRCRLLTDPAPLQVRTTLKTLSDATVRETVSWQRLLFISFFLTPHLKYEQSIFCCRC